MFFATQLKSVNSNGAVDVQGRSLTFVGYLRVKAGDTVYTDGKFIFGNAPPKGAPAIFAEPSGIPVLGDYDSQGDELRGYFAKNGKYKSYQIAGDDWLVNDEKIFKHDEGDNIIDAEIADEDSLITVEKKVQQFPGNDYDSHEGFYSQSPTPIYTTIACVRVTFCSGDKI